MKSVELNFDQIEDLSNADKLRHLAAWFEARKTSTKPCQIQAFLKQAANELETYDVFRSPIGTPFEGRIKHPELNKTFKGKCYGIGLSKRAPKDNHILLNLLVHDDGNWFIKYSFSSSWIDELIAQLETVRSHMKNYEDPDINHPGYPKERQFGWKFRKEE